MLDTLIKNVTAVTMDDEKNLFANAFIGIKDGKIVDYAVVPCESFLKQQLEYGRKYATL